MILGPGHHVIPSFATKLIVDVRHNSVLPKKRNTTNHAHIIPRYSQVHEGRYSSLFFQPISTRLAVSLPLSGSTSRPLSMLLRVELKAQVVGERLVHQKQNKKLRIYVMKKKYKNETPVHHLSPPNTELTHRLVSYSSRTILTSRGTVQQHHLAACLPSLYTLYTPHRFCNLHLVQYYCSSCSTVAKKTTLTSHTRRASLKTAWQVSSIGS